MATAAPLPLAAPHGGLRGLLARHPLVSFFAMAYALTWLAWSPKDFSQQIAMMVRWVGNKHECIFAGPKREDSRVGEEGRAQVRDRSALRSRSRHGQTLLQTTQSAEHPREEEGSRQETKARRES